MENPNKAIYLCLRTPMYIGSVRQVSIPQMGLSVKKALINSPVRLPMRNRSFNSTSKPLSSSLMLSNAGKIIIPRMGHMLLTSRINKVINPHLSYSVPSRIFSKVIYHRLKLTLLSSRTNKTTNPPVQLRMPSSSNTNKAVNLTLNHNSTAKAINPPSRSLTVT